MCNPLLQRLVSYSKCLIKVNFAIFKITLSLYSIESVTYLTAGILDQYENQDCLAESTIIKASIKDFSVYYSY